MSASPPSAAVVICTRNRPDELEETLQSVATQSGAESRRVLVVDGSDNKEADRTFQVVEEWADKLPFHYHHYQGIPAHTRQRNKSIELLPTSVRLVHFIDDDATPKEGYFAEIEKVLHGHPTLLGAGGLIYETEHSRSASSWAHGLFLLGGTKPNRVLPSGHTTPPSLHSKGLQPAEWLSTCSCCYRRSVFETHRFDPRVEGPSPTLHDLDFSYRVAQDGALAVVPTAQCIHRRSSRTRRGICDASRERVVRRYWFVRKNLSSPSCRFAFWWSMLGKLMIVLVSTAPNRDEALRGFLQGLRVIWSRNHKLLPVDSTQPSTSPQK